MSDNIPWNLKDFKNSLISRGRLIPLIENLLIRKRAESTRDTEHIHPSDISKKNWCPRSTWYQIKGYTKEESYNFQRMNVFAEGHAIHAKWQNWINELGILYGTWKCSNTSCSHKWVATSPKNCPSCNALQPLYIEIPLHNDEHLILGHADGCVDDGKNPKYLIEIKSVGVGTIRYENAELVKDKTPEAAWKAIRVPFASHVRQSLLYMYCTGIHEMLIIYEWKATQETKEFTLKYQPELIEPLLIGCKSVIKGLSSGIPPMRPPLASSSSCYFCKSCPYNKVCWKNDIE